MSDGAETSTPDTVTISLEQDTAPPTITLLGENPVNLECGGTYAEAGATAADECSGDLSADITIDGNLNTGAPGSYHISYQVSDDAGLSASASRSVSISDSVSPGVQVADPLMMWPPDHSYQAFSLSDCSSLTADSCEPALSIDEAGRIVSIYSDEPENGTGVGDGNTTDDISIDGDSSFRLRIERQGTGNGRVYGVTFVAEDSAGNTSGEETCYIQVPRCMSARCQDVQDDGAAYTVQP